MRKSYSRNLVTTFTVLAAAASFSDHCFAAGSCHKGNLETRAFYHLKNSTRSIAIKSKAKKGDEELEKLLDQAFPLDGVNAETNFMKREVYRAVLKLSQNSQNRTEASAALDIKEVARLFEREEELDDSLQAIESSADPVMKQVFGLIRGLLTQKVKVSQQATESVTLRPDLEKELKISFDPTPFFELEEETLKRIKSETKEADFPTFSIQKDARIQALFANSSTRKDLIYDLVNKQACTKVLGACAADLSNVSPETKSGVESYLAKDQSLKPLIVSLKGISANGSAKPFLKLAQARQNQISGDEEPLKIPGVLKQLAESSHPNCSIDRVAILPNFAEKTSPLIVSMNCFGLKVASTNIVFEL